MTKRRKPVRRLLLRYIAPPIATLLYRRLASSWRYVTENEDRFQTLLNGDRPVIGAFLHSRTFSLLHYFSRPGRGRWILMCSQSRDGEAMARVEEALGFRVARGSSGGGGARALVEMIRAQREDRQLHSCLAADGSRGPRGIAQLGLITLAQKTGGVLLPVAASTSSGRIWQKSWDRTVFPRKGAEVRILVGEPIDVPAKLTAEATESLRLQLQETLLTMHRDLDARVGFADTEPLQAVAGAKKTADAPVVAPLVVPVIAPPRLSPVLLSVAGLALLSAGLWAAASRVPDSGRSPSAQNYSTPLSGFELRMLPDRSVVELGANSRVTTQYSEARRQVNFGAGEAYFTVKSDPARPFIVSAGGGLEISADSAAFNVRDSRDRVVVAVRDGTVRIVDRDGSDAKEETLLRAGEQALYLAASGKVAVVPIKRHHVASWRAGILRYREEPLSSVVDDLSRYSKRPIVIDDPVLRALKYTGIVQSAHIDAGVRAIDNEFALLQVLSQADRLVFVPHQP